MTDPTPSINAFVSWAASLKGDEKGEAQVFCDRLFKAFGHEGFHEAGATLEYRVKSAGKATKYADLLWKPRVLLEMKKKGEKLQHHYSQAFDYWLQLVPNRPKYVVLCNFEEFWIYDFDLQLAEPVDVVKLKDLPNRFTAMNFLFPEERKSQFKNNLVEVTKSAADKIATVFNRLVKRNESREAAQRFVLQCVVAIFSEDAKLLPMGLFSELINDCKSGKSTYDEFGSLFRQMNTETKAKGGRFKDVRYFNGGLFKTIEPIELNKDELTLLSEAATEDWSKVQPAIFGTLFQSSMDKEERHAFGAHYTSEADIQKVVIPTIVRPWKARIDAAKTLAELEALLAAICKFRVLDPACGSGNFLYVAYRELMRLEMSILAKIHENFGDKARRKVGSYSLVSTKQFFGIDKVEFAVELAKVTLMLAKELAIEEASSWLTAAQDTGMLPLSFGAALPLDNLDDNIVCDDSLFYDWPKVEAIIGNPPYLDARKLSLEHGSDYVARLRESYSGIPGRADYCVYWFRKAHDNLQKGGRAGLVGTNTVRQNYSREGGLDYIVENGGTITEAVSTQVWSGDAAVHVSIVNWVKAKEKGKKRLFTQKGDSVDSPWMVEELADITSSLTSSTDVSAAQPLRCNQNPKPCFEGQQPGHDGFRLTQEAARALVSEESASQAIIHPYLNGIELVTAAYKDAPRYIIDFEEMDILQASKFKRALAVIESNVLEDWKKNAESEREKTGKTTGEHQNRLQRWWRLKRRRQEMLKALSQISRYIACPRVTKRPVFEFISTKVRPDSSLSVFAFQDDYSFGVLQSSIHWAWFVARCSTLKGDFRYTSDTVFDAFPWPQSATLAHVRKVAQKAVALRKLRNRVLTENDWNLRELYRTLELTGQNPMKDAQAELDAAVREAYGMRANEDALKHLLALNAKLAEREASLQNVVGPGLPPTVKAKDKASLITTDCIEIER